MLRQSVSLGGELDYAIVRTGGLQYRVAEGDLLRVPRLTTEAGETVELTQVLALSQGGDFQVGTPLVEGAKVSAEVVAHGLRKKIIVYKKKRRKGYQKTRGHRQGYTELRIRAIAAP
jgi:large subunit ribosomal protein L21